MLEPFTSKGLATDLISVLTEFVSNDDIKMAQIEFLPVHLLRCITAQSVQIKEAIILKSDFYPLLLSSSELFNKCLQLIESPDQGLTRKVDFVLSLFYPLMTNLVIDGLQVVRTQEDLEQTHLG